MYKHDKSLVVQSSFLHAPFLGFRTLFRKFFNVFVKFSVASIRFFEVLSYKKSIWFINFHAWRFSELNENFTGADLARAAG